MVGASTSPGPPAPLQEAMWVADRLAGTPRAHNTGIAVRMHRRIDATVLQAALDAVSARHEMLRASCRVDDDVQLWLTDTGAGPRLDRCARRDAPPPVSFEDEPAWWAGVDPRQPTVLLLIFHHALVDPWSLTLVVADLQDACERLLDGCEPDASVVPGDYRDYVRLTRRQSADPDAEALAYWSDRLRTVAPLPDPVFEMLRDTPASAYGGRLQRDLGALDARVVDVARQAGTTRFAVLLAATAVAVQRRLGLNEVVVKVPVLNRDLADAGTVVGCYSDLVPVVMTCADGESWADAARRAFRSVANAMDLQVPFQVIMDRCVARGPHALVPFGLCSVTMFPAVHDAGRWHVEPLETVAVSHGLQFAFEDSADGLRLILHYGRGVTDVLAASLADHVTQLVAELQP